MLGNNDLGFSEDLLDVANAQRRFGEEVQNPEPRFVTQAFVDRDQFHNMSIRVQEYKARQILLRCNHLIAET